MFRFLRSSLRHVPMREFRESTQPMAYPFFVLYQSGPFECLPSVRSRLDRMPLFWCAFFPDFLVTRLGFGRTDALSAQALLPDSCKVFVFPAMVALRLLVAACRVFCGNFLPECLTIPTGCPLGLFGFSSESTLPRLGRSLPCQVVRSSSVVPLVLRW